VQCDATDNTEFIEEQVERLRSITSPARKATFISHCSDWVDAMTEHLEGDEALLAAAAEGTCKLTSVTGP
jgi:cyclic beta-1,2-glucan synthetase